MIRVVLVDDQELMRVGFRMVLGAQEDMAVVGEAGNGKEALELVERLRPDVVLMDISMPILDGIDATQQIRAERGDACILMLTGSNATADVDRARRAGAAGYVTKDRIAVELIDAIIDAATRC